MVQKLYAIYDSKASFFLSPWLSRAPGIAEREFGVACHNPESSLGKFPVDFVLYEIGEYNDADAVIKSFTPPLRLCDGREALQKCRLAENSAEARAILSGEEAK
nr:MAG: nonstructural protein [Microvirus sp.]